MRPGIWLRRRVGYPLEAAIIYIAYVLLATLPVTWASALFGGLARAVGPRLSVTARARRNLTMVFPEKPQAELDGIILEMWDNLGRTAGEWVNLRDLWDDTLVTMVDDFGVENYRALPADERPAILRSDHIEVVGIENFLEMRDDGAPALLFSAHHGNWELLALGASGFGLDMSVLFRTPNNPYVARLLAYMRRGMGKLLPKGLQGAIAAGQVIERGGHLAMLVDQKLNRGISIPFLGRPAMTSPTLARLAFRHRCPVYGVHAERIHGTRFRIVISPPLELPDEADEGPFVAALMTRVNATVEEWVRARPGQWLWLHRRWPD